MRQRMIRRGMPYGPPLPDGVDDDGEARGLVFVTFQASIARQFEGVQTPWLSDGNIFGLGADRDFLLGDPSSSNTGKMTIQGERPFFLAPPRAFGVMRGASTSSSRASLRCGQSPTTWPAEQLRASTPR